VSLHALLLILGSVGMTAFAQLALKLSGSGHPGVTGFTSLPSGLMHQMLNPWSLAGLVAYGASFVLWLLALRDVPLSVAYPFMGLTLVLVALLGVFVLGEPLSAVKVSGMVLVFAGLILISKG